MYSPKYALETNTEKIDAVIAENAFATIVYGECEAFHLPLFKSGETLIGHMARANFALEKIKDKTVLVIFHGPHCYISPNFYGTKNNVPTWNYISVHVRGKVSLHENEAFLKRALIPLSHKYDSQFDIEMNIADNKKLFAAIVGVEISMDEVVAKFKLAQSKPVSEREHVISILEKSEREQDRLIAREMKKTL